MRRILSCFYLVAAALIVAAPLFASTPNPNYWPTCDYPQHLGPLASIGGSPYRKSAVVWNGKEYGVAWVDRNDDHLYFRRFFADGTPDGPKTQLSSLTSDSFTPPALVWTGSEFGLAWRATSAADTHDQIYFLRLSAGGSPLISPFEVSYFGQTQTGTAQDPTLAWSGAGFIVAWDDTRNSSSTGQDIYATILTANGTIAFHDIAISTASGSQYYPSAAWSVAGSKYVVVWQDGRSTDPVIYGAQINSGGVVTESHEIAGSPGSLALAPDVVGSANGTGLVWTDTRDGNYEIYYALLAGINVIGSPVRVTNNVGDSQNPRLVWTGAEFAVFWEDNRTGAYNTWFQRITPDGTLEGSNMQVTDTSALDYPGAAFARYGFMTTGLLGNANYLIPWGCTDPASPACPDNLIAYGVSSSTATLSWQPVDGAGTDIAYYEILKNNTLIAKTADNFYTVTGLTSGTTYNFSVVTVNAAQQTSAGCSSTTSSIYVKSSTAVTLKVNKNGQDAVLSWTDSSNMASYNVYRGTNPQVMQKLGSTSEQTFDDANALANNNVYFYTVDDPGQ